MAVACTETPSTDGGLTDAPVHAGEDAGADASDDGGRDAGMRMPHENSLIVGEHEALFIGNSYVYVNDVSGHYRAIADVLPGGPARVEAVTAGGWRLEQHATDAQTDGTPLSRWLRTGTEDEMDFDVVVFQEQSQIGGFPDVYAERIESLAGASSMAALARANGAAIVLYLTWGREHGDPTNPDMYGTFEEMQDLLDAGYLGMASRLVEDGSIVRVAPVGPAFREVLQRVRDAGGDPFAEGSDFDALYDPDGSHPSLRGAYLAACVLAGTVTAEDAQLFPDEAALGAEVSTELRDVCATALADPRWAPDEP
jgi:hypothetical protein